MIKLGFVPHSKISGEDPKSDFWVKIHKGVVSEADKNGIEIKTYYPKKYHDVNEFYSLTNIARKECSDLIIPFPEGEENFVNMLNTFEGRIVFVNAPPDKEWKEKLTKKIPYVGGDIPRMGRMISEILTPYEDVNIIRHEQGNAMHDQLLRAINLPYEEIMVKPGEKNSISVEGAVISLGIQGTKIALENGMKLSIAIDCNGEVKKAFESGLIEKVLTQSPEEQGRIAVRTILNNGGDYLVEPKVFTK